MERANGGEASIISVSFIEIYMDQVYDLLSDDEKQIKFRGKRILFYIFDTLNTTSDTIDTKENGKNRSKISRWTYATHPFIRRSSKSAQLCE